MQIENTFENEGPALWDVVPRIEKRFEKGRLGAKSGLSVITVSLNGVFRLSDQNGEPIMLGSRMSRRLLAILARAPNMRRSREQLQMLLWDDTTTDPGSSLRQLILQTRKRMGLFKGHLCADGASVWLDGIQETSGSGLRQSEFFEDAGYGTEEFEDWLRAERQLAPDTEFDLPITLQHAGRVLRRPQVTLYEVDAVGEREAEDIAGCLQTTLHDAFCRSDFLDVFGSQDAGEHTDVAALRSQVRMKSDCAVISFSLHVGARLVWSHSVRHEICPNLSDQFTALHEVSHAVSETVERKLANVGQPNRDQNLYGLVTQLFTLAPSGVSLAAQQLGTLVDGHCQSSLLAWRAFAQMLQSGEMLVADQLAAQAAAEQLIQEALDHDPENPSALTIAAQYYAFVHRDYDLAKSFSDESLRAAPFGAFAHDVRATIELYQDRLDQASHHSKTALSIGRRGPLRHYLAATEVMLSTVQGRHQDAIHAGRAILAARPSFLPVMRHVSASLAATGQTGPAQDMIKRIHTIDPLFATNAMQHESYPLPSAKSREVIFQALNRANLVTKEK